jgi:SPP1 gp7 family putative phage head morphogenesis protein
MNAVFEGAGTNFDDADLSGDQYDLLQKFEKNIYYFSGFKNYQQLKEANELLLDENRNIRPFSEFLQLVKKINTKYNVNYLSAEYGHAVASAQMATKWQEIQAQQEDLPFLQYDTVGDDRVRDEHRGIDGVIRRVDDDFWKTWYPPNGWNCRCSVRQLDDAKETPVADIVYPELLPMFRTNVGVKQVIFPANHPYMQVPNRVKVAVTKNIDPTIPKRDAT